MIGKTISHYKILEKLGEGGMGIVYKAEDTKLKRTVALKFLSTQVVGIEEEKKRFVHEAQAAAALNHPNICTVFEIDEAEGQIFIAMTYLEGESLRQKTEAAPLKLNETLNIAMQVAQGLQEAHEQGIVHRDIKSSNVMITSKGEAIIMDFGLAKQEGRTVLTKQDMTLGTIAYMSPEQGQGIVVDHRTDIWSFGVLLYEMVSAQLPFKGDYDAAIIYSIMNEEPEPLTGLRTGVPMELERIVLKAMAKNPGERYQNVNDMLIDLRSVAKELETATTKTKLITPTGLAKEEHVTFFENLWTRRLPQILGLYLLVGLGVVQLMQWLVNRYPLSPNLADFSFAALVSMIPTVFLLAYFHGKPGRDHWTRAEKIGIPMNLFASAALLFVLFSGKELGAVQATITLQDEEGNTVEAVIPKSEFRKKISVFFFDNTSGDSTLNWLQYGIPLALMSDLDQDLFLNVKLGFDEKRMFVKSIDDFPNIAEKMKKAGFPEGVGLPLTLKRKVATDQHLDYFVSGSFAKENEKFLVSASLYETRRLKLLAERTFTGLDIFKLIDELSVQLKYDLEIPHHHIEDVEDLPVSEILTNSISAFKSFVGGSYACRFKNDWETGKKYLEQAVEDDPMFAYAWIELANVYFISNQSKKAEAATLAAMQHKYKLSERRQFDLKYMYYFSMKQDMDKVLRLVQYKVELFPDDIESHAELAFFYRNKNQMDEAISAYKRILELDPRQYDYLHEIGLIHEQKGEYEKALQYYVQYANHLPEDHKSFTTIGNLYEVMGDHEQAKSYYEKALLIEPEDNSVLRLLANSESNLGFFEQALKQYLEALRAGKTPKDSAAVYRSLSSTYERRGQLGKAVESLELAWAEDEKFLTPLQVLMNKLSYLTTYVRAGKQDVAFQTIETMKTQLPPPLDKVVALAYLSIYLELEDADKADNTIKGVEDYIKSFGAERMWRVIFSAQGRISELRRQYEQAILSYQKALEIDPTDASINRFIGRCYRNLKEFKKAEESIQKALKVEPYHPESLYEIALVYHDMDKKERALQYLKKALYVWEDADPGYKPAKKAGEKLAEWEPMTEKM